MCPIEKHYILKLITIYIKSTHILVIFLLIVTNKSTKSNFIRVFLRQQVWLLFMIVLPTFKGEPASTEFRLSIGHCICQSNSAVIVTAE